MRILKVKQKMNELIEKIGKDKLFIMAAAGIVLILCSYVDFGGRSAAGEQQTTAGIQECSDDDYIEELEKKLEDIISGMEGAGNCKVMITKKTTGEKILQSDLEQVDKNSQGENVADETNIKRTTVIIKSDDMEQPYVISENMPQIEGIVVLAQGAGKSEVNSNIIKIVQALFDVELHKISIAKMR